MSNIKGTFNTVSKGSLGSFGGHFPVWARIENRLAGGGYFDLASTAKNPITGSAFAAGDIVPAGTMVVYTKPGCKLTIIPNGVEAHASATTYAKGDVVYYNGSFYSAKANSTSGSFSAAAWDAIEGKLGLVDNDVEIPTNAILATAAVVVKGRIYADRVIHGTGDSAAIGLPAYAEALLPMIEFVRE